MLHHDDRYRNCNVTQEEEKKEKQHKSYTNATQPNHPFYKLPNI
jgi:hypothetical protein